MFAICGGNWACRGMRGWVMAEGLIGAIALASLLRDLYRYRWRRRRLIERAARRLGFSRKRAEGIARRVI